MLPGKKFTKMGMLALMLTSFALANQMDQITPAFKAVSSKKDAKHTPKIECPDEVKAGEWFEVTITIGAEKLHPSLEEHSIQWIAIFKNDVEISRTYLHSVHSMPKVTYTIALEESCTLRAMEAPNHAAPFVSSKKIKVKK